MSETLAQVGGPVAVAGFALLVLGRDRALRLGGLALWAVGAVLLAPVLAPSGRDALLAGVAVAGLALATALAVAFRRWPWLLPLLALAAVPARIPVSIGDTEANLLVPLYVIVVAAAVQLAWELATGDRRSRELGLLAWPLALLVGWLGLSIAWTSDVREGAIELLFFLLPFGLLAVSLSRLPWREPGIARVFWLLSGMAVLFAVVGIGQWVAKDVFWNPKVVVSNDIEPFFRVNSLFWDPSIYGRFLVVALLAALVVLVHGLARRWHLALVVGVAVVWVGLFFSYSQSSFVSLVAGILVLGAVAWRGHVLAAAAVAATALALLGATTPSAPLAQSGLGSRGELVRNGVDIALDHPVVGVGLGGFRTEYAEKVGLRGPRPPAAASHTTPVTVAAETGIPGLLLFLWLLGAAAWGAFRRPAGATTAHATTIATGLAVVAIAVHSCFYNAFFEDPMLWGALGLLALAGAARREDDVSA